MKKILSNANLAAFYNSTTDEMVGNFVSSLLNFSHLLSKKKFLAYYKGSLHTLQLIECEKENPLRISLCLSSSSILKSYSPFFRLTDGIIWIVVFGNKAPDHNKNKRWYCYSICAEKSPVDYLIILIHTQFKIAIHSKTEKTKVCTSSFLWRFVFHLESNEQWREY